MSKKEKKAVNPVEEVPTTETKEATVNPAPTETKAPVKKAKTVKTEKTAKSSTKKTVKAVKEIADTKVETEVKAVDPEIKEIKIEAPVEATAQVYFQFAGTEISTQTIIDQVKNIWSKTSTEPIQSFDLYIKPEENAAYYVINNEATGKVEL